MESIKSTIAAFFDFLQGIVVFMALLVMVYFFIISPQEINGQSMDPTFHNAELILTNKFIYKFGYPKRGDVVIFKSPRNKDIDYIKRIIGLPGERVKLFQSVYYVNDQKIVEPYIAPDVVTSGGAFLAEGMEIEVPDGEYFVTGDNRPHSSDSREFGTIPLGDFIGKAFLRYFPFNRASLVPPENYGF